MPHSAEYWEAVSHNNFNSCNEFHLKNIALQKRIEVLEQRDADAMEMTVSLQERMNEEMDVLVTKHEAQVKLLEESNLSLQSDNHDWLQQSLDIAHYLREAKWGTVCGDTLISVKALKKKMKESQALSQYAYLSSDDEFDMSYDHGHQRGEPRVVTEEEIAEQERYGSPPPLFYPPE